MAESLVKENRAAELFVVNIIFYFNVSVYGFSHRLIRFVIFWISLLCFIWNFDLPKNRLVT